MAKMHQMEVLKVGMNHLRLLFKFESGELIMELTKTLYVIFYLSKGY